jgi:hypothetical protein
MRNSRRKHWLPLTYEPKIQGVIEGTIRQTIRAGRKYKVGEEIAFHGWEGKPYWSPWSFRTGFFILEKTDPIRIFRNGITFFGEIFPWNDCVLDEIALADGIDPPTGEELGRVLSEKNKIPEDGLEAQILRW